MTLLTDRREGTLVLTLNRPDARNALNGEIASALHDALTAAGGDDSVRTIVVTGAGDKVFSAGMDLRAYAAGEDLAAVGQALQLLADFPKPVISACNGSAVAGGFEIVMRTDLVVAADHAQFGIPEVKRGLVAAGGGTRLPARIPLPIALELGLTGEPISAVRALELGLVNRVVPATEVLDTALELAALIEANGPLAVQATKLLMREEVGPDPSARIAEVVGPVFASEDATEGATAFAEKRPAVWKGR